jgi:hypothetical protein
MTELELAYLAGFFDGEGSVGIYNTSNRRRATRGFQMKVTVSQTDPLILNEIKEHFGGTLLVCRDKAATVRTCWQWTASSLIAAAFLRAVLPHLRQKREQAELALQFQAELAKQSRGHAVTPESTTIRVGLAERLKALKWQEVRMNG